MDLGGFGDGTQSPMTSTVGISRPEFDRETSRDPIKVTPVLNTFTV